MNTKGIGENSQEIRATTRVDRIPVPLRVAYDKSANSLSINVPATCLPLVAVIETISNENHPVTAWQVIDTLLLQVSEKIFIYPFIYIVYYFNSVGFWLGTNIKGKKPGQNDDQEFRQRFRQISGGRTHRHGRVQSEGPSETLP